MAVYCSYNALALRLSKPSQKPDPPEKTNQIRSDTGRPNYSSGRWQVFPTRNQFQRVDFGFPPPKPDKLEPTNKNPDSSEKPIFRQKFSKSRRKNPDSSDISHRSSKILTESSEISSNPMRHLLDLAKSHRIRWDFRWIWVFLAVFLDIWHWPTRPPPFEGLICPTQLLRWLAVNEIFYHPIQLDRFWVGHKPDPDQPVDSPNWLFLYIDIDKSSWVVDGMAVILIHTPAQIYQC